MNIGLLIGKKNSMGCPGKNVRRLLGRPVVEYGFLALDNAEGLSHTFVSTDSPEIAAVGQRYGAELIARPAELAQPSSRVEDTLIHAFGEIEKRVDGPVSNVVLVFANSPTIQVGMLDRALGLLEEHPEVDSVTSVCQFNMFSPARARKIGADGLVEPFIDLSLIPGVSSIRDEQGACYFEDFAVQALRRRCFTHMIEGEPPFKWMGRKSYAMVNEYGFDIDFEWQIPVVEFWLREHGFTEHSTPYNR